MGLNKRTTRQTSYLSFLMFPFLTYDYALRADAQTITDMYYYDIMMLRCHSMIGDKSVSNNSTNLTI